MQENVLFYIALHCKLPLIQVNESALSCFSDLRRRMFRPGLISNVIWNVISNCLSQSGFELNLSFSFAVFSDAHIGNIMIVSSQLTMTLHKEQRFKAGRAKIEKPVFAFFEGGTPPRRPLISALKVQVTPGLDYKWHSLVALLALNSFSELGQSVRSRGFISIIFQEGNSSGSVIISSQNAVLTPEGFNLMPGHYCVHHTSPCYYQY